MILVGGLSPAWQQIVELDRLDVGEVNRALQVHWCASGKVVNVALALKHLDAPHQMTTVTGGGTGRQLENDLAKSGVDAACLENEGATRICTTILDRERRRTTELVENANPVTDLALKEFQKVFTHQAEEAGVVVLTGSLPANVPPTIYRDVTTKVPNVILDARGPELDAALDNKPLLVKPNREELQRTVGRPLRSEPDVASAMQHLIDRGAEWVVVTDGARSVLVKSPSTELRITPPTVPVDNPIGCGDCLTAGIAYGVFHGWPMIESIRFGVACAAYNAEILLPARLKRNEVDALFAQVKCD